MIRASPVTKALANHAGGQPLGERFVSGMVLLILLPHYWWLHMAASLSLLSIGNATSVEESMWWKGSIWRCTLATLIKSRVFRHKVKKATRLMIQIPCQEPDWTGSGRIA
jgi:hypothetical protein